MTPAATEAIQAIREAADLLQDYGLTREAVRLRYFARTIEAELKAQPLPPTEPESDE
jgi:hypothetical protein